jgi:hypothetical protein
MKNMIKISLALLVVGLVSVMVYAQSDATSRAIYVKVLQDQSTPASVIGARGGLHVARYSFDISGACVLATAKEFSQGDLPDNAIIAPGGYMDITTAMLASAASTGVVSYGSATAVSSTVFTNVGVVALSTLNGTKLAADTPMNITFTGAVPTTDLTFTIYQPYYLGN